MDDNSIFDVNYTTMFDDLMASAMSNDPSVLEEHFLEDRCQFLVDQDVIQDYHIVNYNNEELKLRVDAWGFRTCMESEKEGTLVLILNDFCFSNELQTQSLTDFRVFLNKGKRFFQHCLKEDFRLNTIRESEAVSSLADYVYLNQASMFNVLIVGITNKKISARKNNLIISENSLKDITLNYDTWDFERFLKIEGSTSGRESVDIDFIDDYPLSVSNNSGLPVLQTPSNCSYLSSYLFVLPSSILVKLYDQWNERLLDQNPRTFLQFSGKVNKGLRNTIYNMPERFFSYNNGISAVAESIEIDDNKNTITKINNFQIVNGGQTTASIYFAAMQAKKQRKELELDKLSVMVKLTIVDADHVSEVIPKISEYSNTQNKVNPSAFSINHPFHRTIEKYSRNIWTPSHPGEMETHWYYERVQGQYKNAIKLAKTPAAKRQFENNNPKKQMFKHTDLSKYILTFDELPHIVCLGAQKCYARFCSTYLKIDEEGMAVIDSTINETMFKEIVSKALLTKMLDKTQTTGIRFVSVPYTLAIVVRALRKHGYVIDYDKIWQNQWDGNEILINTLVEESKKIMVIMRDSMPDTFSILSEWGKREACWKLFDDYIVDINPLKEFCISSVNHANKLKEAKKIGAIDVQIAALTYVCNKGDSYWRMLFDWSYKTGKMDPISQSILKSATNFRVKFPSEKQAKAIKKIEQKAIEEGFFVKS